MKKVIFLVIVLAVISCQQTKQTGQTAEEYQAEVKEKIAQFNKLYFEAWENELLDSTLFFLDEGFINMFSFGPSQTKEECREAFQNVFDMYSIEDVKYESVELLADQNYAIETGLFKQTWISNDKQDTVRFDMRGMSVFKKQEDGSWKMFRLVGQQ
jgi:ketosteroid isomerase-like protein